MSWLDEMDNPRPALRLKRALDVVASAAGLTALAPVLGATALAELVFHGWPPVFVQPRPGLNGRIFHIVKFRTMTEERDAQGNLLPDAARLTKFGRFLRETSIDELPELWNVLKGDMSLVGPRPERPYFVDQFKQRIPQYMLRHKVRAGLTGWAQVNGWRGNTSIEKRIEYDLYYIENWSVTLDLKIMWLTLLKGFFHKHAY